MKKIVLLVLTGFLLGCNSNNEQNKQLDDLAWLDDWLNAWELISTEVYKIDHKNIPEMLFYDKDYVYTTSRVSAPNGKVIDGPTIFETKLVWYKQEHSDSIIIPDGTKVPVQLMTFAAPSADENKESFFVMASPEFWKNAGIESEEVGLEKMLTGVFLHEFSHTRQMNGIGKIITNYEKESDFKFEVGDDLIQDYFKKDSIYERLFRKEVGLLYKAYFSKSKEQTTLLLDSALTIISYRHINYLDKENKVLADMDKVFLSMEGLGQFSMVSWLIHPKGGNINIDIAIEATRRGKNWWSQEEGLAAILVLDKLSKPNWKNDFFGNEPKDVVTLLSNLKD